MSEVLKFTHHYGPISVTERKGALHMGSVVG